MRIGDRRPLSNEIKELGFSEADSIKILGLEIDYDLNCLSTCHDLTIQKIAKISNFWKHINLSLPGRINIIKTLMLSQISYLGCIITPTEAQFNLANNIIESFARKNLNISKERLYLPAELGGDWSYQSKTFYYSPTDCLGKKSSLCQH